MSYERYLVTVTFPANVTFYTNQWNVDGHDDWTVKQFFDDMCASLNLDASSYWLLKNGVPLVADLMIADSVESSDTVTLVPA
jgi:hypothetical protein